MITPTGKRPATISGQDSEGCDVPCGWHLEQAQASVPNWCLAITTRPFRPSPLSATLAYQLCWSSSSGSYCSAAKPDRSDPFGCSAGLRTSQSRQVRTASQTKADRGSGGCPGQADSAKLTRANDRGRLPMVLTPR